MSGALILFYLLFYLRSRSVYLNFYLTLSLGAYNTRRFNLRPEIPLPSSSGLGRWPLTPVTGVRIP